MADDPLPSNQNTIGDQNTITHSTIHQSITHQAHPWQPRWEPSAAEAQALLAAMPRDHVPDISALRDGRGVHQ